MSGISPSVVPRMRAVAVDAGRGDQKVEIAADGYSRAAVESSTSDLPVTIATDDKESGLEQEQEKGAEGDIPDGAQAVAGNYIEMREMEVWLGSQGLENNIPEVPEKAVRSVGQIPRYPSAEAERWVDLSVGRYSRKALPWLASSSYLVANQKWELFRSGSRWIRVVLERDES